VRGEVWNSRKIPLTAVYTALLRRVDYPKQGNDVECMTFHVNAINCWCQTEKGWELNFVSFISNPLKTKIQVPRLKKSTTFLFMEEWLAEEYEESLVSWKSNVERNLVLKMKFSLAQANPCSCSYSNFKLLFLGFVKRKHEKCMEMNWIKINWVKPFRINWGECPVTLSSFPCHQHISLFYWVKKKLEPS